MMLDVKKRNAWKKVAKETFLFSQCISFLKSKLPVPSKIFKNWCTKERRKKKRKY